jgi:hypothetical protein
VALQRYEHVELDQRLLQVKMVLPPIIRHTSSALVSRWGQSLVPAACSSGCPGSSQRIHAPARRSVRCTATVYDSCTGSAASCFRHHL